MLNINANTPSLTASPSLSYSGNISVRNSFTARQRVPGAMMAGWGGSEDPINTDVAVKAERVEDDPVGGCTRWKSVDHISLESKRPVSTLGAYTTCM
jgi:hypothetical protein